jgi:hypothetical protein
MFKVRVILSGDIPDLLYWSVDLAANLKRCIWNFIPLQAFAVSKQLIKPFQHAGLLPWVRKVQSFIGLL